MSKAKDPKKLIKNLSGKIKVAATKLKSMREELKDLKLGTKAGQSSQVSGKALRGPKTKAAKATVEIKPAQGRRGRPKKLASA